MRPLDDVTGEEWNAASAAVRKPTPKPKQLAEGDLQRAIMIALSDRGHLIFRANVGLFYTRDGRPQKTGLPTGFPDTFGARASDGAFFGIEVKTATGRLRTEQRATLNAMRRRGLRAGVARSIDDAISIVEGDAIFETI